MNSFESLFNDIIFKVNQNIDNKLNGKFMSFLERILISLSLGVLGLIIGFLLGMVGVTDIGGYPTPYTLGAVLALIGLFWGKHLFDLLDIFDWFSS